MMDRIKLGISACLLGENVRYDGSSKLDRFLRDTLGLFVEYIPVCPEVEYGLPVPREAMHLEGDPENPRLVTIHTREDITGQMENWIKQKLGKLENDALYGFIFKSDSPSCGMERIRVHTGNGLYVNTGAGIWARMFRNYLPFLPVEDDERLNDCVIRENFIERIFVFGRWRESLSEGKNPANLDEFHIAHKLVIMSHSIRIYHELEKLVTGGNQYPVDELYIRYQELLIKALNLSTTTRKNVNVLYHITGYLKNLLTPDEKQEFIEIVDRYSRGDTPLLVPITLINHYVSKYDQSYLKKQYYLNPHPLELKLRNHA